MNELYPVAKLGDEVLVVNKDDIPFIGKERAIDVKCINVDLKHKEIDPITELEKHLKFNPWEETDEEQRTSILQSLASTFSDQEILEKIIEPLAESLIEPKE
ncbi:MAG: hypothetical protein UX08_C0003G0049 [Candidatus Collierbacteria bacterium GW2011_GWB1_45_35]|uniref:Uncharacterized protein n=1 Tax=Candidatus Collierbacteria bacterium GW2011_GWB2_45_17 TaxID=1618388 RepID=A0A837IFD7_9BACT|nr:MAG: hypothetical protein UW48_C0006G0070 [Microgenomates group bacterium GW2011_GWC1_44_23]KKT96043.1 MAG: hypothetical protein UW96_C0002G0070 [Candidatus Collierbacteria bacterium GW2011_GWA1_45_15]KKU01083.1 MAG: hypothetical protein UX01_C0002G0049 [Candidatus Collierbacteria bacterium GW2011_GWB2_45_17]KKU05693.1 MAG: hypothetical protein UX08_C0003G0049 [Candidatus Collierbacteria bacterium GW2011_GWB1_45_35]KKU07976.1 MAG: hypothetical protein UX11_C0008G0049 [Candidatus Collierbacte